MLDPRFDIYRWVDDYRIWDTQLLHRLYVLGQKGHTATGQGESTLERCADEYLGIHLPKDVQDSKGRPVRLSYGKWLNRPGNEIEPVYLDYLAKDAIVTFQVFARIRQLLRELLEKSSGAWGYVSPAWLADQVRRWGPQTHHIQLKASVVLAAITANGLTLDLARKAELTVDLQSILEQKRQDLHAFGYQPDQEGSGTALQGILKRLERQHPELDFPRTPTGKYSTSKKAVSELADFVPFLKTLSEHDAVQKLLNSFLDKMGRRVLHPSFNVLARSGRTTSFGEINAQNLPRDDKVRSCFVPPTGHLYLKADYATIEMATLAQAVLRQFGLPSAMATAINAGKDLHRLVAARVTGKPESAVSDDERQKAKPINFGKPGAMGDATLKSYAGASYGVKLDDDDVVALSDAWFALFPEMRAFLQQDDDLGNKVARVFGLTPATHFEHTGDRRFLDHPENIAREEQPHSILGWMCLKALKTGNPVTRMGSPYCTSDLDYFWSQVEAKLAYLPANLHGQVRQRHPSQALHRAVMRLAGSGPGFTLSGRVRAAASYAARHNTAFQGLAADGAKLALWLLWRAGYRIANFVHDEVLIEVPADSDLKEHAEHVRQLMIQGMGAVVPDVRVDVEYAACDRWYKKAKPVFDESGTQLRLWQPRATYTFRPASDLL